MKDAEKFAEEDKKQKETIEIKNRAESLAFQCEKTLGELGDKIDEAEKAEVQAAVEKLRATLAGGDTEAIKADMEALEKSFYKISEKLYQQSGAGADAGAAGAGFAGDPGAGAQGGDGTFYSADYEDKSDNQ